MTDPRLYVFAIASVALCYFGVLFLFQQTRRLGKWGPPQAISRKEEKVAGGVMVFVGVLGLMTSYAVLIKGEPMFFVGYAFELVRWFRGE